MAYLVDVKLGLNLDLWNDMWTVENKLVWDAPFNIGRVSASDETFKTRLDQKVSSLRRLRTLDPVIVGLLEDVYVNNIGNLVSFDRSSEQETMIIDSDQQSPHYLSSAQPAFAGSKETIVLDSVFPILRPGDHIYGHWVTDILPRLWVLSHKIDLASVTMVVRHNIPSFALKMLELFGVPQSNICLFNPNLQNLRCKRAYYATNLRKDQISHPMMGRFSDHWTKIVKASMPSAPGTPKTGEKVYISRGKWIKPSPHRVCLNSEELEDFFLAQDEWHVVHPQDLSLGEQLEVFSNAKVVVGEEGSGLHNSLFMPSESHVISLRNTHNFGLIQSGLCRVKSQTEHFVFESIGAQQSNNRSANFYIDICRLSDVLSSLNF